jgi:hypothetical protein
MPLILPASRACDAGIILPVEPDMMPTTRTSLLRAPLMAVVILLLALWLLFPGAALRAQNAPTLPVPAVDGEVSDMFVKGKSLEVHYRNVGTVATAIVGEVQVRTADDSLVMTVPLVESMRVDAGRKATLRIPMPALPRGKYTLYAVVDFGGEQLTAAQAALEVVR